jgi:hypothetical protein
MNETLSTEYIDCRPRTGSAGLLCKIRNTPTSSPLMASELSHIRQPMCRIRTPDSRNLHREANNRNNRSYNPHSSLDTIQPPPLRPRGFLP